MIDFKLREKDSLILGDDVDLICRNERKSFDINEDSVIQDCKNIFYFDSGYLIVSSYHECGTDLASIMFPLNKRFISQLKSMISCIESNGYEDSVTGEWVCK